jgi:hypothetical protein
MKKVISLLLTIMSGVMYGYGQTTYVVENGVTYTRIFTIQEYQSLGLMVEGEEVAEAARKKKSGTILWCKKGYGCCLSSRIEIDGNGGITAMTVVAQVDDEGNAVQETSGIFAYYNSELDEVIYRVTSTPPAVIAN